MKKGIIFLLFGVCILLSASNANAACDCTVCHGPGGPHGDNPPTCNACHGTPPVVNSIGGPDGLVKLPAVTGSASAGAHEKHATTSGMNYLCGVCHYQGMPETPIAGNYRIQIGFGGGSYDGQTLNPPYSYEGTNGTEITYNGTMTCSTIYCHSDGTGGTSNVAPSAYPPPADDTRPVAAGSSPSWDGIFPMACSNWTGQSCSASSCHVAGTLKGYRSCYFCHGMYPPDGFTKASYPSSPHKCYGCHGYPPIYTQDQPKSNTHGLHSYQGSCNACHHNTTTDGMSITGAAYHANGVYDVVPDTSATYFTTQVPVNFDYAYDIGGGTCSNISCHQVRGNGTTDRWGNIQISINRNWGPGPGCYEIIFNASAYSGYGGIPPYTYFWDFGDGATSTEQNPTHIYPSGGTYNATVYARDVNKHLGGNGNLSPTAAQSVNIAPVANFAVSVLGWTVTLTDLSYDTDYNQCGHSGPGHIEIMWGESTLRTNEAINLTAQPSNRIYTHTYADPGNRTANNRQIIDIITDNSNIWSQKGVIVRIPSTYTVGGRVANAAGVGLQGAIVYLRTMSGQPSPIDSTYSYTDANGYYTLTGAVEGECHIVERPFRPGRDWITFTPGDQTVCAATSNVNFVSSE